MKASLHALLLDIATNHGRERLSVDKNQTPMHPEQAHQIECAFLAGVAFGCRVQKEHGDAVVVAAIEEHIARKKADLP